MHYQRSLEIERRLETVLALIREGRHSTPDIAARVRVSVPTVSRDVAALRERGHDIVAECSDAGWRYRLNSGAQLARRGRIDHESGGERR